MALLPIMLFAVVIFLQLRPEREWEVPKLRTDTEKIKAFAEVYGSAMNSINEGLDENLISQSEWSRAIVEMQSQIPREFLADVIKMRRDAIKKNKKR